jgi:hypothetical protein
VAIAFAPLEQHSRLSLQVGGNHPNVITPLTQTNGMAAIHFWI